jgi:hypothetical protein
MEVITAAAECRLDELSVSVVCWKCDFVSRGINIQD